MIQRLEAKYELYDSVEEMLSPESMSEILGRTVANIESHSAELSGASNSQFHWIVTDNQRFLLKHTRRMAGWLANGTDDAQCRALRLWQYGILDHLQPGIEHATTAACYADNSYALLMQDVSTDITPYGRKLTIRESKTLLSAIAHLHASHWNSNSLRDCAVGLMDSQTMIEAFWPNNRVQNTEDNLWLESWWELLFDYVDTDVCNAIQELMRDPKSLYTQLANYPMTLVHGDFRPSNIGINSESGQVIALDWQLSGFASPFIDLHWFLTMFEPSSPFDCIEYYRQQLAKKLEDPINNDQWQAMIEIGFLASILRIGLFHAGNVYGGNELPPTVISRKILPSFNEAVRKGLKWL